MQIKNIVFFYVHKILNIVIELIVIISTNFII